MKIELFLKVTDEKEKEKKYMLFKAFSFSILMKELYAMKGINPIKELRDYLRWEFEHAMDKIESDLNIKTGEFWD
jgi:hypothetical protein